MRLSFGGVENKANTSFNEKHCFCDSRDYSTFMICCDYCDIWYHGACVQVTRSMSDRIERYSCPICVSEDESHVVVYKNIIKEKTPRKKPTSRKGTPGKNSQISSARSRTSTPSRDMANGGLDRVPFEIASSPSQQPTNTSHSVTEISSKLGDSTNLRQSSSFGVSRSSPTPLFSDALTASLGSVPVVLSKLMQTTTQSAARFSTSPIKGDDSSPVKNIAIVNYIAEAHQKKSKEFVGYRLAEIPHFRSDANKVSPDRVTNFPAVEKNIVENEDSENALPQLNESTEDKFLTGSDNSAISVDCLANGLKEISCYTDATTFLNVENVSVDLKSESRVEQRLCPVEDKFLDDSHESSKVLNDSMTSTSKPSPNPPMNDDAQSELINEDAWAESSSFSVHPTLENDELEESVGDACKMSDTMDSENDESKENILEESSAEWIQNDEGLLFRTPRCNNSDFSWKPSGELCTIKMNEKKNFCNVDDYLADFREKNRCAPKLMELLADDCSRSSSEDSEHSCAKSDVAPTHTKLRLEKCQNIESEISPSKHINGLNARRALINIPETPDEKLRQRHNNARKNFDDEDVEIVPQTPIGKIKRERYEKKTKLDNLLKNEEAEDSSGGSTTGTQTCCASEPLSTINNGGEGSVSAMSRRSQQLLDVAEIGADAFENSTATVSRKRPLPQRFSQRNTAKRTLFR